MAKQYGFGRSERLKSRKQIDELFASGKSLVVFPIRVSYRFFHSEQVILQAAVSVSKKYFKKAVDRNRIKRLLREAYRLQKPDFQETLKQKGKSGYLFFIYTDKGPADYRVIFKAMQDCLKRLEKNIG
jgi:ribonuclease P protein component